MLIGPKISIFVIMKSLKISFSFVSFAFVVSGLSSCAGSSGNGEASMGDSGCDECGEQGEMELEITEEKGYAELDFESYGLLDSSAVIGSFPALKVVAEAPENCKFCHSFSEDAVDFDLAHYEDSLITHSFPKMDHELMFAGMRVPEEDSSVIQVFSKKILLSLFAEGKPLSDLSPWASRARDPVAYASFDREVPRELKMEFSQVSRKYNVRYLSIPLYVKVTAFPKLGRSGGYSWKSLWTLWDARLGRLVFLSYNEFTAETKSRIAPERGWAKPFAERLGKVFSTRPSEVENH